MALKTDYKDFILSATMGGRQRFRNITNADGSYSIEDVSEYDQEGDIITASDLNGMNTVANNIQTSVTQAQTAATTATTKASEAEASASQAATSAGTASQAASEASASASSATAAAETVASAVADVQTAASTAESNIADAVSEAESTLAGYVTAGQTAKADAESAASDAADSAQEAKDAADSAAAVVGIGIATTEKAGIVKPDGETITVAEDGTITSRGGGSEELTQAEYDALSDEEKNNGTTYYITDGVLVVDSEHVFITSGHWQQIETLLS